LFARLKPPRDRGLGDFGPPIQAIGTYFKKEIGEAFGEAE
jgi:hypothetical protein